MIRCARWPDGYSQKYGKPGRSERLLFDRRGVRRHRRAPAGEAFGVGAAWRPVLGGKGNPPEARVRVDKFNPNFRHLQLPRVDVHHGTYEFFASRHMFYVQNLPDHDWLVQKDQGAVGIHHLRRRAFTERRAVGMFPGHNHAHGKEDALAAALMGHASLTRIVCENAQGPLLWVFACMRSATELGML